MVSERENFSVREEKLSRENKVREEIEKEADLKPISTYLANPSRGVDDDLRLKPRVAVSSRHFATS